MVEEESCCVPPGFRFHPTEEELVGYYLARKVASQNIDLDIIQEVDLYRIEPWDLQERCKYGGGQEQEECWYFFSYKDRKYPSGTRTNRATAAGFWKATGRDKPVLSRSGGGRVIGMRKTLVFYKGRAPNGRKTDWIMHEYRLQSNDHHLLPTQEEGWVVCRAFRKPVPNHQRPSSLYHHHPSPSSYGATPIPGAGGYYVDGDHFLGSTSSRLYPQLYNNADHDLIVSKNKHLLLSIPQLIHNSADDELIQGGGGLQAAGAIDWNFLDTLLSSSMTPPPPQLHDPSSSSLQLQ